MEVLAHSSASVSKRNDDKFRAQAQAYLDFEPAAVPVVEMNTSCVTSVENSPALVPDSVKGAQEQPRKYGGSLGNQHASESPFHRLEKLQKIWKQMSNEQSRKSSFDAISSSPSVKYQASKEQTDELPNCYLETQFAAAAVESQIEVPMSQCDRDSHPSPAVTFLKRRKLSVQANTESSPSYPTLSSQPHIESGPNIVESAQRYPFSTPEPEISSLLPDSYGLSMSSQSRTPATQQDSHLDLEPTNSAPISHGRMRAFDKLSSPPMLHPYSSAPGALGSNNGSKPPAASGKPGHIRSPLKIPSASFTATDSILQRSAHGMNGRDGKPPESDSISSVHNEHDSNEDIVREQSNPLPNHTASYPTTEKAPEKDASNIASEFYDTAPESPTASQEKLRITRRLRELPTAIDPTPLEDESSDRHVTSAFRAVSRQNLAHLKSKYEVALQVRELDPWERGYWMFSTRNWDLDMQFSFWEYLIKFISSGRAGSATRVERESEVESEDGVAGLGNVKVWCFGNEVEPMYLVLYTASLSRIRKYPAEWRSWKGETLIRMKNTQV